MERCLGPSVTKEAATNQANLDYTFSTGLIQDGLDEGAWKLTDTELVLLILFRWLENSLDCINRIESSQPQLFERSMPDQQPAGTTFLSQANRHATLSIT